jgi:hypothetical protein
MLLNILQLDDFKWLGNASIESIRLLREQGEMQNLRYVFKTELDEMANASDDEFEEVAQQVKYNLETALRQHESELNNLDKTYNKKYGLDVAGIVIGTISGVSSMHNPLIPSILSTIGGVSLIDLFRNYLDFRETRKELQQKPVGILFEAKKTV